MEEVNFEPAPRTPQMIHGWRSSIHYWSRRGEAVKKAAFMIALGSFFASWLLIPLMKPQGEPMLLDPLEQKVREDWKRLFQASDARPRELSRWLRQLTPILPMLADSLEMPVPTWVEYQTSGKLLTYEVKPLLARHCAGSNPAPGTSPEPWPEHHDAGWGARRISAVAMASGTASRSSTGTGRGMRQLGCWSMVPGRLGRRSAPTRRVSWASRGAT